MAAPEQGSGLQIFEDVRFQQRTWKIERAGWLVLGGIVIAALVGVFGEGIVGTAHRTSADGSVSIGYARFWRLESPTALRVEIARPNAAEGAVRLWIARNYLDAVSVPEIMPPPQRVEAGANRLVFEFAAEKTPAVVVRFRIEPLRPWRLNGALGVEGGQPVRFSQIIFP